MKLDSSSNRPIKSELKRKTKKSANDYHNKQELS